jgi:hypothetical protein
LRLSPEHLFVVGRGTPGIIGGERDMVDGSDHAPLFLVMLLF